MKSPPPTAAARRASAWRRGLDALAIASIVGAASVAPAFAAVTASELVAQADRLVEAADASVESLQHAVLLYADAARLEPTRAEIRLKQAAAALEAGDATATDPVARATDPVRWYELGRQAAERAIALDDGSAHAHFLLAAHRGQIAKRRLVAPSIVGELEEHLRRCLALNPRHSRALHMMGRLLRDTPIVLRPYLKGSRADVERYLVASVEIEPNFPPARLDLAEHYRSTGRIPQARAQARAVIELTHPTNVRTWRETHRPAAEALLKKLAPD